MMHGPMNVKLTSASLLNLKTCIPCLARPSQNLSLWC